MGNTSRPRSLDQDLMVWTWDSSLGFWSDPPLHFNVLCFSNVRVCQYDLKAETLAHVVNGNGSHENVIKHYLETL